MNLLSEKDIRSIFALMADLMNDHKDLLTYLDAAMGDGDLGLTMSTGFSKVSEEVRSFEEKDIGKIFVKAGMVMAQCVPSTMGTLMATGLMKGGKVVLNKQEVNLSDISELMNGFTEGIRTRGKANPGDKTVIDSLQPATQALQVAVGAQKALPEGLKIAYKAALQGVEDTKNMISQHGRAAYYQEKTLGTQDPGATVGMLFIKAFYDYISAQDV